MRHRSHHLLPQLPQTPMHATHIFSPPKKSQISQQFTELRLTYKWDVALEDFAYKATIGAGICGLASLVLFRGGSSRLAFTMFGMGFGSGDAYRVATIGKSTLDPKNFQKKEWQCLQYLHEL